jgi:hypothetical protein
LEKAIDKTWKVIVPFLLNRVVVNTPIDTGALRKSLAPVYNGMEAGIANKDNISYALRIHEEIYNLGPLSRNQPKQPEGGVGNKYITRVVDFWEKPLVKMIGDNVEKELTKTLKL